MGEFDSSHFDSMGASEFQEVLAELEIRPCSGL